MSEEAIPAEKVPKEEKLPSLASAEKALKPELPKEEPETSSTPAVEGDGCHPNAQRFLGGRRTLDKSRLHLPRWFGLFVLVSTTLICMIAFLSVASWAVVSPRQKPELICLVEAEYMAPAIPLVRYGLQDGQLIRSLSRSSLKLVEGISRTTADDTGPINKQFFEHQLDQLQGDTCVIYIAAQGVSDEADGYLLHRASHQSQFGSGFSLTDLLAAIETHGVKNVLLLLDTVRVDRSVQLGMLGNDFSYYLKRDFEVLRQRAEKEQDLPNLCIICSADDGQISAPPPGLATSPFALTTAYALQGGPGSKVTKGADQNLDGRISALEIAEYVERAISDWSLEHQQTPQTPFHLHLGEDFPLVFVDHMVTLDSVLAHAFPPEDKQKKGTSPAGAKHPSQENEPSEKKTVGTETNSASATDTSASPPKVAATDPAESGDSPQTPEAGESKGDPPEAETSLVAAEPSLPETEMLIERIYEAWQKKVELEQSGVAQNSPLQWSRLKLALLRAESALLANMPLKAQTMLDVTIPKMFQALEASSHPFLNADWSLAFAGEADPSSKVAAQRGEIEKAITQPDAAAVNELRNSSLIEASLVYTLSERLLLHGTWRDPALVELAVQARSLGVPVALYQHPYLLRFVKDQLEAADIVRRRAEVDLITGRLDQAEKGLRRAETQYREVAKDLEGYLDQVLKVKHSAIDVPAMISWLGMHPGWGVRKKHDLILMNEFMKRLAEFCNSPSPMALATATHAAQDIRERGIYCAEDALQPVDWINTRAVLKFTFLEPEVRRQLLLDQYPARDFEEFNIGFRQDGNTVRNRPANPLLLDGMFTIISGGRIKSVLLDRLKQLSPVRSEGYETFTDLQEHESIRQDRAYASGEIRCVVEELCSQSINEFAVDGWWKQWASLLLLSESRADRYLQDEPRDLAMEELIQVAELDLLKWNVNRLYEDSLELPGYCYGNTIQRISEFIKRYDRQYTAPVESRYFALASDVTLSIPAGEQVIVPLRITALQDPPQDSKPLLVLQNGGLGTPLRFAVDGQEDVAGRVTLPLDANLVAGQVQRVWLKVAAPENTESQPPPSIAAMVELAAGQVDWLPLHIHIPTPQPKPAELSVEWDDQAERNGRIDLYPNQSLPIDVGIVKHAPEALNLRIELLGSGAPQSIDITTKADETGRVVVPPITDMAIPLEETLVVRLYNGATLLDEREIELAVLDLLRCFERQIYFDPQAEKVNVTVSRIRNSDVVTPVPVQIQLSPTPAIQGTLTGQMLSEQQEITLDAIVPPEIDENLQVQLGVAGVSRVFRDRFGLEHLAGEPDNQLELRLAEPQPESKYLFAVAGSHIPVKACVDGPEEIGFHIGFDWNHNGQLDASEIQQGGMYWSGKSSELNLVATVKPPGYQIESHVADITLNLNTSGVIGHQTILARAMANSQSKTVAVPVYVLKTAPEIEILQPTQGEVLGLAESIRVVVQSDWSMTEAVDTIEFAFDKNGNGQIDKGESVAPVGYKPAQSVQYGKSHRLEVHLPTKGIEVGPMTLLARTISEITEPAPTAPPSPAPATTSAPAAKDSEAGKTVLLTGDMASRGMVFTTTGKIEGQVVTADGVPRKGAVVKLEGAGEATSDAMGNFAFNDISAGSHKLTAQTNQRSGTATAEVEPGQTVNLKIMIAVQ